MLKKSLTAAIEHISSHFAATFWDFPGRRFWNLHLPFYLWFYLFHIVTNFSITYFFSLLDKRKKMRVCTIKASLCFPLFIFSSILNLFLTCFCFIRNCFRGSNAPSPSLTLTWWDQILLLPLDINLEEIQHCSRLTCFRKKKNTLISTMLSSL